jgi:hypothetical protein
MEGRTVFGATHVGQRVTSQFQKGLRTYRERIDLSTAQRSDERRRTKEHHTLVNARVFICAQLFQPLFRDVSRVPHGGVVVSLAAEEP